MNEIKKRKCIICKEVFEYNTTSTRKKRGVKGYRGRNSITCSRKCSRIYVRIYSYIYSIINRKKGARKKK